jgi:hypothetical protein
MIAMIVAFILRNAVYVAKSRALSSRSLLIFSFYYELVLDVVSNSAWLRNDVLSMMEELFLLFLQF